MSKVIGAPSLIEFFSADPWTFSFIMKDSPYFRHDTNARHDPKIKAIINRHGLEGYGMFWVIIENLRESNGYKLENEEYNFEALAQDMRCNVEKVKQFISDCIKFKLLIQADNFFYSFSLIERMSKLDEIREKRIIAGKKGGEKGGEAKWD